jgi:long-chain acyl-CoA synthetase
MDHFDYRLFDAVEYQAKKFPKTDMLNAKVNSTWRNYSTLEVQQTVNRLSAGLLKLGVSGGDMTVEGADKIAIISNNRPEWVMTDLAVQQTGAILTPLYPTTSVTELEFILNDALVKYIFVSSKDLYEKIISVQPQVPSLKGIYTFENVEGAEHWTKLTELADDASLQKIEEVKKNISNQHVATIIYTSGTTGVPKGVMLTHKNIVSNVYNGKRSFPFYDEPDFKALSFLPLNHIFEKLITYIYLFGANSIYYAESLETIGENLKEVKPQGFTTVPRLLEKVYEKIMAKGSELTGIKKKLFYWAVDLAKKYDNQKTPGVWYDIQLKIANKLIFKKWREALGGNIQFIITGGAACPEHLMRIFNAGGIPIYEGYGPTENSPVICVNRRATKNDTKFGTVGPPIEGQEVKLAEDGEIMVKGPSVMKGYYKRPDLTEETMRDGWLLTGDIGTWVDNKFIKITDRKKELFKTSGGKYVAPQPIENKLKESPYIEQALVVGADKKFVAALIVPNFPALREWMRSNGIEFTSNVDTVNNENVNAFYNDLVSSFNKYFNHVEQVKKIRLLPNEWSLETGEMTPKMSLKRKVIMEKFKAEIESIYS